MAMLKLNSSLEAERVCEQQHARTISVLLKFSVQGGSMRTNVLEVMLNQLILGLEKLRLNGNKV